jgi:uncharacterized protein (TIGR00369 family)
MADFDAIAQGMTQAVPFAAFLGLEITEVSAGEAVVRLPERAELTNHVGSQHAGALFTVAEGKVEFPCEIELVDGAGVQVATATVGWHVRLNKPAAAEA